MKNLLVYRSIAIIATLSFLATGCAGNVPATEGPAATQEQASSQVPAVNAPTDSPEASPEATSTTENLVVPVSGGEILYHDDFTDPSSGWTEDKFDNYFIGYHE